MIEICIGKNEENQRLDKFLRKYLSKAHLSFIYKLIRKNRVKVNSKKIKNDYIIKRGDLIQLYISQETLNEFVSTKKLETVGKNFTVIYEDKNILLVDKPKGLLVHEDRNEDKNTLINQMLKYLYNKGEYDPAQEKTFVPACVNRLDRNTSGIVIIGKNNESLQSLSEMIRKKFIRKYYLTIVKGVVAQEGELKGTLIKGKDNIVRLTKTDESSGKFIHTIYKPINYNKYYSLLEVEIITGRTHQIRLHLSSIDHPIVGDYKYGDLLINDKFKKEYGLRYQLLHAYKIVFEKTTNNFNYLEGKTFHSFLPSYFENIGANLFSASWEKMNPKLFQ